MQGIIMRGHEVLATLAGSKSQIRRVLKGSSPEMDLKLFYDSPLGNFFYDSASHARQNIKIPHPVGALRYVKESYWPAPVRFSDDGNNCADNEGRPRYVGWDCTMNEDSRDCARDYGVKKKSPLFMPQWASRLHIKITGVRVERVQSISDADVMREGCLERINFDGDKRYSMDGNRWFALPKHAYAAYFVQINGAKAWDENVWGFVYDYDEVWRKQ